MNLYYLIAFIVTLIILVYSSWRDIKTRELSNWIPALLFAVGVIYRVITSQYDFFMPIIFFLLFGYALFAMNLVGGADIKILIALSLLLPYHGFANASVVVIAFTIIFGLLASLYGLICRLSKMNDKAALMPVILLAYILIQMIPIH